MFEFITNGLIWVTMLLLIYFLCAHLRKKGRKLAWWKWVLFVAWLLFAYISIGFIGTAMGEGEPGAALRGGGAFLVLTLVSGFVLFRYILALCNGKKVVEYTAE